MVMLASLHCPQPVSSLVRYAPQSRYFQINELAVGGKEIDPQELEMLHRQRHLILKSEVQA